MNNITLYSVADFLDGRHFFIPAYQRGYRWSKTQMKELVSDLFEFALRSKAEGEFYCLQPIIVQRVTEKHKLDDIKSISRWTDVSSDNTWEVIDGQQRLTSIYIIYKYLIDQEVVSEKKMAKAGKHLYSMCYETHPETKDFLESLTSDTLEWNDIDQKHMAEAFQCIEEWFDNEAAPIARRMERSDDMEKMQDTFRDLLNCKREDIKETTGSAQFIWYELEADSKKNPIDEFLNINNGKIRLTDAELIKALFLQEKNFVGEDIQKRKQTELAIGWENIENSLHRDDFWQFLSSEEEESDNRIELLLKLCYQQAHNGDKPKDGALFRYYYNDLWNGQTGTELQKTVIYEWQRLCDLYHVIESWYEDPILYNYVGFLIHAGCKLYDIVKAYYDIDKNEDSSLFLKALYRMIAEQLPSKKDVEEKNIKLSYRGGRGRIKTLLLFLNVYQQNKQIEALRQKNSKLMAPAYKFPFDLYVSQSWDVEHIDSATPNDLSKADDKREWLRLSIMALNMEHEEKIKQLLNEEKYDELWNEILRRSESLSAIDELKDSIGNLTLLDYVTNRGYGNHIFAVKRAEILKAIKSGTFVPLCTQLVFNKSFDERNTDLRKWSDDDKRSYEEFILSQLQDFYKSI